MSINLLSKEEEKLIFHVEELEALLEGFKDHKIAVVSIAGAFRTGKSFLISWLLKYIQQGLNSMKQQHYSSPLDQSAKSKLTKCHYT